MQWSCLRFYKVTFFVSACLSLLVIKPVHAADLSSFVADTISAHPDVREQVHIFRQAVADKVIAKGDWKPRLDLEASFGKFESESPVTGPDPVNFESSRAELSLTQNLYDGSDTANQVKQTDSRINSALYELYDTADNIALQAIQAYLEMLKQQRLYELAIKNVNSHEETLDQIRVRSNSGVGRRSQLEQTEGRVARAHASLIAQQNNLQDAATQFHQIVGRYVDSTELVEPDLPVHSGLSIEELIAQALQNHPAIRVADYNVEAAEHDYRRSLSKDRPTIDLRLAQEVGDDINGLNGSTDDLSLVLNLNYNLYRGGADRAEQKQKISVVHERQQFAARVRRQVINTLRLAWAADKSLASQLAFLQAHVEKSEATLASYREEFFIGQRDLINVLDAENELNSAQNSFAEAYFDYLAARFRIREAVGGLFDSLNLDAQIKNQNLVISKIQAKGKDRLPYGPDQDADTITNPVDHCDNSIRGSTVSDYGCKDSPAIDFESYQSANIVPVALQQDLSISVKKINTAPEVVDDELELAQDTVLNIALKMLLENDADIDGDSLSLERYSQPDNGELAQNTDGNLVYRPHEGFVGDDKFSYTVSDGNNNYSTATVRLIVTPNDNIDLSETHYVNFLFDRTELTDVSREKVDSIIAAIKRSPNVETWIFAHTDNLGSSRYNLSLSKRRANALRDLLISAGVDGNKIKANGVGESHPLAANDSEAGRAINRRGEFHFNQVLDIAREEK